MKNMLRKKIIKLHLEKYKIKKRNKRLIKITLKKIILHI